MPSSVTLPQISLANRLAAASLVASGGAFPEPVGGAPPAEPGVRPGALNPGRLLFPLRDRPEEPSRLPDDPLPRDPPSALPRDPSGRSGIGGIREAGPVVPVAPADGFEDSGELSSLPQAATTRPAPTRVIASTRRAIVPIIIADVSSAGHSAPTREQGSLPPGPSLPRLAQLGARFVVPVRFLEWCVKRYGDIFTLRMPGGENVVSISNPDAIKAVFRADPETLQVGVGGNALLEPLLGSSSLLLLDGGPHIRRRKLVLPPFHGERMQRYGELMSEIANDSLDGWPRGTAFPLQPRMQAITLDIILRAVFGVEDAKRQDELRTALRSILDFGGARAAFIPWVRHWVGGPWVRFMHQREQVDSVLYEEIARRRREEDAEGRDDIFSLLLQARYEDGSPMSDKELRDELVTLLVAGHETTATALSWTFELLFRNGAVKERLVSELGDEEDRYLGAVITESLRLRPVIGQISRKTVAPFELDGYVIPAGTLLSPSIQLVHRRPDIYPEPHAFKPERFLEKGPETYTWLPFGGGVRRCVGASFAIFEMKVVLKAILARAELRAASSEPEPPAPRAVTMAPKHGAMAVLERLDPAQPEPQTVAVSGAPPS
jgi:cytochrome P450 family 135